MNNQVIVVDDHPSVRLAVSALLRDEGYTIVAESDNGEDVLELVQRLKPSWLILDLGLPGLDGFGVIKQITDLRLPVSIIVLSSETARHVVIRCQEMGARGFVSKQDNMSELLNAISAVKSSGAYFAHLV
ncbi:response regulator transcription factor [Pseudomonas sp. D47]|uniref:response regulator n=1 Tax=Pseudomonas sp. D47 TaxID=3159447 RepID=UPI00387B918F